MNFNIDDSRNNLYTLASWEDRFVLGLEQNLITNEINNVTVFYIDEFQERTRKNTNLVRKICKANDVNITVKRISYSNTLKTHKIIKNTLKNITKNDTLLIDYSTMTREVLWTILGLTSNNNIEVNLVYWRPETSGTWTTKNTKKPRLIIGRSGVSRYGLPTLVAISTGFDTSRIDQIINYFEPEKTLLFIQTGEQFKNNERNSFKHTKYDLGIGKVECYDIDSYSTDQDYRAVKDKIRPYLNTHNIVLASFGPKPSALAFHRLNLEYPDTALCYIPALDFNPNYSTGIGNNVSCSSSDFI